MEKTHQKQKQLFRLTLRKGFIIFCCEIKSDKTHKNNNKHKQHLSEFKV